LWFKRRLGRSSLGVCEAQDVMTSTLQAVLSTGLCVDG
jgi:hypothetical protein